MATDTPRDEIEKAMRERQDDTADGCGKIICINAAVSVCEEMVRREREHIHKLIDPLPGSSTRLDLLKRAEAAERERDEALSRVENEIAARRRAQEHGVGDRARIEELEEALDENAAEVMRLQGELSEARGALAEYLEKWGHVQHCDCRTFRKQDSDNGTLMHHDPRCAPLRETK